METFNKNKLVGELKNFYNELFSLYMEAYECNPMFGRGMKRAEKNGEELCCKAAIVFLNKILFVRICRTFADNNPAELVLNHTLGELIYIAFKVESKWGSKYARADLSIIDNNEMMKKRLSSLACEITGRLGEYDFQEAVEMNILGDIYEDFMSKGVKKSIGQYYTPDIIIDYILENTLEKADIVSNPYVRVLDPACGSGCFLTRSYDVLKRKFIGNISELRRKYKGCIYEIKDSEGIRLLTGEDYWKENNLHYHILKHCIYGADIDEFSAQLTTINLLLKEPAACMGGLNILVCDSLVRWEKDYDWRALEGQLQDIRLSYEVMHKKMDMEVLEKLSREKSERLVEACRFWDSGFDYVVGNPPYVGHKQLTMERKKWFLKEYKEVFKDKSDISYCFFQRMLEVLKSGGRAGLITSRYFMESPTGRSLRVYLKNKSNIIKIVDFYGAEIFKGIGVAPAIYIFSNDRVNDGGGEVYKLADNSLDFDTCERLEPLLRTLSFERFELDQELLDDERWILIPEWKYNILKKIEEGCSFALGDIVISFQGIITGCDRAFILNGAQAECNSIEKELLRPWIKNSNVDRYLIEGSSLKIIYSDFIKDENGYQKALGYIGKYKDRLEKRRECRNGYRKWYELQWGRDISLFEKEKVVYPYKSKHNRFAVDRDGYLCSADVYSFCIRNTALDNLTLEYLVGILNSSIYEFYFKLFAKKMGSGIYDYYPNSILCLKIPAIENCMEIHDLSMDIMKLKNDSQGEKAAGLEKKINLILKQRFKLTDEEMNLIECEVNG